jgi:hypothetical protein
MKRTLGILLKGLAIILIVSWVGLILIEHNRHSQGKPMLVVLNKKIIDYYDGHVYVYTGLGYKSIIYERTSLNGKEFGPIFISVRNKLPKEGRGNEIK